MTLRPCQVVIYKFRWRLTGRRIYRGRVARLLLINGAPGSGKSTLARRYVADHPLALALDIDVVRAMLGRWMDLPWDAGTLARRLALEMARVHLLADRDVVVPQFLGRVDFVQELEAVGDLAGATFVELVLLSDPQNAAACFTRRSADPRTQEHRDAAALQELSGGDAALPAMYQAMMELVASRPKTRRVVTVEGLEDCAYAELLAHLEP